MMTVSQQHPERFGRYEVEEILGRGAMGIVYLARDPAIDRRVAIKVLHAQSVLDPEEGEVMRQRFEREIRSAGTLSHPNIVTVYDVGQQDGHDYLAMEFVRGESLEDVLKSGRDRNLEQVAEIAEKTAAALDYAHASNIVHRDVKPGNIMLAGGTEPKVADFGVAKLTNLDMTTTGTIIGTPKYMAPEQIIGKDVGPATDQWALAVVMFELLTGELPFEGDNPTTMMYRVVHDAPRQARSINSELPKAIDEVLNRALSKKPKDRFASCSEFARALRRSLAVVLQDVSGDEFLAQDLSEGSTSIFDRVELEVEEPPVSVSTERRRKGEGAKKSGSSVGLWVTVAAVLTAAVAVGWAYLGGSIGAQTAEWSGSVEVVSSAPGAEIWLDGADTGKVTPASVDLTGHEGESVGLELRRDGEHLAETSIVLGAGVPPRWEPELGPVPQRISVVSVPEGATVVLDDEPAGTTPSVIQLEPGREYELALTLDGYRSVTRTVSLEGLSPEQLASGLGFELTEAEKPGYLAVDADYPVNVEAAGTRQRGRRAELPPGRHEVVVSAPEVFYSGRHSVEIASGQTAAIELPPAIEVTVAATPGNCRVSIDGRDVGFVPVQVRLAVGSHTFDFSWPGIDQQVTVTEMIDATTSQVFQVAPQS